MKLPRSKRGAHDVAMQRQDNAELHFDEELVKTRIDARMRQRSEGPNPATALFLKVDLVKRCSELVVLHCEMRRLTIIHAAENREAIHPICGNVESKTCVICKMAVVCDPIRVTIAFDDLIERNPRCGGRNRVFGQAHPGERVPRRNALVGESIE